MMPIRLILGCALLLATSLCFGQVTPSGFERPLALKAGVGYSNFDSDWNGRLSGPALWVDWSFNQGPAFLQRLGIEAEARDLNYARTSPLSGLRFDTAAAGPTYTFRGSPAIRPYCGFLVGLGSIDFPRAKGTGYSHDTRTIYEPGAGVDWLIASRVRLRAAYEYQFWPDFFYRHTLNPSGLTLGASYAFGERSGTE
jgi:opacity protein-like surface antigen